MGLAFNRVLDRPLSSVPQVDGVAVVDQNTVTPYKLAMTNVKCNSRNRSKKRTGERVPRWCLSLFLSALFTTVLDMSGREGRRLPGTTSADYVPLAQAMISSTTVPMLANSTPARSSARTIRRTPSVVLSGRR